MHSSTLAPVRLFPTLLVASALLFGGAVRAATPSPVKRYLGSAATFYDKLDFERALEQVRKAQNYSKSPEDDTVIALVEGILLANLQREDDADAAFRRGLSLQPDAALPFKNVAPKILERFERMRAEVKKSLSRTNIPEAEPAPEAKAEPKAAPPPPAPAPAPTPAPAAAVTAKPAQESSGGLRHIAWIPAAVGVALGGGAAFCYIQSENRYSGLTGGNISPATAAQYHSEGPTYQTAALILAGTGAAALVTGGVFFLLGGASDARAVLVPTPQGMAVTGTFP